ncbi:MAG: protein kinase, partial [Myxococcota bacterium]
MQLDTTYVNSEPVVSYAGGKPRFEGGVFYAQVRSRTGMGTPVVLKIAESIKYDESHLMRLRDEATVLRHITRQKIKGTPKFITAFELEMKSVRPHRRSATVYGVVLVLQHVEGAQLNVIDEYLNASEPSDTMSRLQIAAGVMVDIAKRLKALSERFEVIHRDVTPSNILVSPGGESTLIDFGLARSELRRFVQTPLNVVEARLVGRKEYLPPEIFFDPSLLTHKTDVFILACTCLAFVGCDVQRVPPEFLASVATCKQQHEAWVQAVDTWFERQIEAADIDAQAQVWGRFQKIIQRMIAFELADRITLVQVHAEFEELTASWVGRGFENDANVRKKLGEIARGVASGRHSFAELKGCPETVELLANARTSVLGDQDASIASSRSIVSRIGHRTSLDERLKVAAHKLGVDEKLFGQWLHNGDLAMKPGLLRTLRRCEGLRHSMSTRRSIALVGELPIGADESAQARQKVIECLGRALLRLQADTQRIDGLPPTSINVQSITVQGDHISLATWLQQARVGAMPAPSWMFLDFNTSEHALAIADVVVAIGFDKEQLQTLRAQAPTVPWLGIGYGAALDLTRAAQHGGEEGLQSALSTWLLASVVESAADDHPHPITEDVLSRWSRNYYRSLRTLVFHVEHGTTPTPPASPATIGDREFQLVLYLLIAILGIAVIYGAVFVLNIFMEREARPVIRMFGGTTGGAYQPYMVDFSRRLSARLKRGLKGVSQAEPHMLVLPTEGAQDNCKRLLSPPCNQKPCVGLIHSARPETINSECGHPDLAVLAPVFDEVTHLMVRMDKHRFFKDKNGRPSLKISRGAEGSGTRVTANKVLRNWGFDIDALDMMNADMLRFDETLHALSKGRLDAAFIDRTPTSTWLRHVGKLADVVNERPKKFCLLSIPRTGTSTIWFEYTEYRARPPLGGLYDSLLCPGQPTYRSLSAPAFLAASKGTSNAFVRRAIGSWQALFKSDEGGLERFPTAYVLQDWREAQFESQLSRTRYALKRIRLHDQAQRFFDRVVLDANDVVVRFTEDLKVVISPRDILDKMSYTVPSRPWVRQNDLIEIRSMTDPVPRKIFERRIPAHANFQQTFIMDVGRNRRQMKIVQASAGKKRVENLELRFTSYYASNYPDVSCFVKTGDEVHVASTHQCQLHETVSQNSMAKKVKATCSLEPGQALLCASEYTGQITYERTVHALALPPEAYPLDVPLKLVAVNVDAEVKVAQIEVLSMMDFVRGGDEASGSSSFFGVFSGDRMKILPRRSYPENDVEVLD